MNQNLETIPPSPLNNKFLVLCLQIFENLCCIATNYEKNVAVMKKVLFFDHKFYFTGVKHYCEKIGVTLLSKTDKVMKQSHFLHNLKCSQLCLIFLNISINIPEVKFQNHWPDL